jgi:hypothetical protein
MFLLFAIQIRKFLAMSELKTRKNQNSVQGYLDTLDHQRKTEITDIISIMQNITGNEPVMWGDSIVGFGLYHYKYASGREGDWFYTGVSSRKNAITIYLMCDVDMELTNFKLGGKYKTGKSCLYLKKLSDIDINQLELLIKKAVQSLKT